MRPQIPQHFTASAVVIEQGHVLLVYHKRIGAWVQPGGHIEPLEMPHEAAIREVYEETGVVVEVVSQPVPQTANLDAFFLYSPLCLHAVRAFEQNENVYHLDLAYLCKTVSSSKTLANCYGGNDHRALPKTCHGSDVKGSCWIKVSELDKLPLAKNVRELVRLACERLSLESAVV